MKKLFLSALMLVSMLLAVGCGQQCQYGYTNYNGACVPQTAYPGAYNQYPAGYNQYPAGYNQYSGYNGQAPYGYPQH